MENTIENKEKFFALYHKQRILKFTDNDMTGIVTSDLARIESGYLELKPLSSITDEYAKELSFRLGSVIDLFDVIHENSIDLVKDIVDNYSKVECLWMLPSRFTDKARELGYAIDWNDLSVEALIEYGWVKLIDK